MRFENCPTCGGVYLAYASRGGRVRLRGGLRVYWPTRRVTRSPSWGGSAHKSLVATCPDSYHDHRHRIIKSKLVSDEIPSESIRVRPGPLRQRSRPQASPGKARRHKAAQAKERR